MEADTNADFVNSLLTLKMRGRESCATPHLTVTDAHAEAIKCIAKYDDAGLKSLIDSSFSKCGNHSNIDENLTQNGFRLLFLCLATRASLCLTVLLEHGSDPNTPLSDGLTPIWWAIKNNYWEGATILSRNKNLEPLTPLQKVNMIQQIKSPRSN